VRRFDAWQIVVVVTFIATAIWAAAPLVLERTQRTEAVTPTVTLPACPNQWQNCVDVATPCPSGSADASAYACGLGFRCCVPEPTVTPTWKPTATLLVATPTPTPTSTPTATETPKPLGTPTPDATATAITLRIENLERMRDEIMMRLDEIGLLFQAIAATPTGTPTVGGKP
jgi:hypothetical protein